MTKNYLSLIILTIFSAAGIFASSLSFVLLQNDRDSSVINSTTYDIENYFMNNFFDSGNVVTNLPAVQIDSETEDMETNNELYKIAMNGSCNKLILIYLYYNKKFLKQLDWKIMDIKKDEVICEGSEQYKVKDNVKTGISKFTKAVTKKILHELERY